MTPREKPDRKRPERRRESTDEDSADRDPVYRNDELDDDELDEDRAALLGTGGTFVPVASSTVSMGPWNLGVVSASYSQFTGAVNAASAIILPTPLYELWIVGGVPSSPPWWAFPGTPNPATGQAAAFAWSALPVVNPSGSPIYDVLNPANSPLCTLQVWTRIGTTWTAETAVPFTAQGTPAGPPPSSTITGQTAAPQGTAVSLTWVPVSGCQTRIYRSTTSGGNPWSGAMAINTMAIGQTSYQDPSLTPGTTYYYVMTAVSPTGAESAISSQVNATILTNGQALQLNGGGTTPAYGYATLAPASPLKTASWSLSVWVKDIASGWTVFGFQPRGSAYDGRGVLIEVNAGYIYVAVGTGTGSYNSSGTQAAAIGTSGSWCHVVFTFNPTNNLATIYFNGAFLYSWTANPGIKWDDDGTDGPNPGTMYVGAYHDATNSGPTANLSLQETTCKINLLQVYSATLSQAQVTTLYNSGHGLVAPITDGGGNTIAQVPGASTAMPTTAAAITTILH